MVRRVLELAWLAAIGVAACGGGRRGGAEGPTVDGATHVIEIDIDDHGLAGLWMARAPNLQGLIGRGTLAFSRVDVPTHSNQNNITLLTGQYPEGTNVPSNSWLSRTQGFASPVSIPGLSVGDYVLYGTNPLLTRGDSVYRALRAGGQRSAYVGELPPFDAGADEVHLSIVGTTFGPIKVSAESAPMILEGLLAYPADVVSAYHFDGPPTPSESRMRFTLRDAAAVVRATDGAHPLPAFMFVWDFIALDDDPTGNFGADGAQLTAVVEDYDAGLGELLSALSDKGLLDRTNLLFTLDHGKVDTHNQAALGTHGGAVSGSADGQLGAVAAAQGATFGVGAGSYALLNEDGDALIYARVAGAGTVAGALDQADVTHKLVSLIQSGALTGVDTTRTMTADGWLGTRRFHDLRVNGPNQADVVVFPQDDWTLNQVDPVNTAPGPFQEHAQYPYGRHGGFSVDELYVPLIMAGPAFKSGVLLPHPVEHADVAPTALAAIGGGLGLRTAARGPIQAALTGDPGETIAVPDPPESARELVLQGSGFLADPAAPKAPTMLAPSVVVIDVAGLYDEEAFSDPATAAAAAPLRDLAARGTRFEDCWTRSRDWPVTEYQMITGGYPVYPFVAAAEDDPSQTLAPGAGLLAMPPAAGFVANPDGLAAWRAPVIFPGDSVFDAAHLLGRGTALLGDSDFHALHTGRAAIDVGPAAGAGGAAGAAGAVGSMGAGAEVGPSVEAGLASLMASYPRFLAVVAVGTGARTSDRHAGPALEELATLSGVVADVAAQASGALIVVTSRGATPIDDPQPDFYGPGTSRHVPLLLLGPGVRAGVVSGQPAAPADLPATILFALGAATTTDFARGTWATGAPIGGVPQPIPASATEGHVLLRAFAQGP
jgi:hypothetical protein